MADATTGVPGLNPAKQGTDHWWHQRITAGSNFALMLWFVISIARLPAYDYATLQLWLSSAWAAVPMLLLVISVFYHFRLGLQVVIEDYQTGVSRVVLTILLDYFTVIVGVIAAFSILKIAFTAAGASA